MTEAKPRLDPELVVRIQQNSLSIQSHFQLLLWVQGDFQEAIPHDVMITFSGALNGKTYHYDIVSAIPGIRTAKIPMASLNAFRRGIHAHWKTGAGQVTAASIPEGCVSDIDVAEIHAELREMKHLVFHAIPDTRFNADHLYIFLRRSTPFTRHERQLLDLMLPHVDAAVRKIDGLPVCEPEKITSPTLLNALIKSGLTTREIEILEWVRNGKTNIEIGMILDISSFTVKNHLQRIFKKINVTNRAQAVGRLDEYSVPGGDEVFSSSIGLH